MRTINSLSMQVVHGSDKDDGLSACKLCRKSGHGAPGGIVARPPWPEQNRLVSASALKSLGFQRHGQAGLIKKAKKC
ncbi:MAG: hypothetical protein ACYC39_08700 [Thiobacillus sp.]|nr:hypothetical protein [Gammaproteobacteria bacterium]HQT33634.1 hypothetical protein [Thiobacillus sp.]